VPPLFNQAHQAHGAQPRALANAVLQYARHIDNLGALGALPAQIIQKHVALQILPEHYPIVGTCLLRAIREVLGEEIATDAVIEAWGEAYWQLANILIGAEAAEYERLAASARWLARGARFPRRAQGGRARRSPPSRWSLSMAGRWWPISRGNIWACA
jgi:nitric oxide dioxygenase